MKERSDQGLKHIDGYLLEKPVALAVAQVLTNNENGFTATDLAEELHMSVPTLYRYTNDMYKLGLLEGIQKGRRFVFHATVLLKDRVPQATKQISKIEPKSKFERLSVTKELLDRYDLLLNPRTADIMVNSVIKQLLKENLPKGIRPRIVSVKTILNENIRFDFSLGTNDKVVAIEIKIIETFKSLRDRLSTLSMLDVVKSERLEGIVIAFILTPIGGKWLLDEDMIKNAINSMNNPVKIIPVVVKVGRNEILDTDFLRGYSNQILRKVKEILH